MIRRKQVAEISGILYAATVFDLPPVTNTTSEITVHEFTLPANTLFAPGQQIEIVQKWSVSTGSSNKIVRIRHVNEGNTQIQSVTTSATTQVSAFPNRRLTYLSANQFRTVGPQGAIPDAGGVTTTILDMPINWTIDNIFALTAQPAALTDSITLRELVVRIFR